MAAYILSEPELLHAKTIQRMVDYGDARGGLWSYALRRAARRNVAPLALGLGAYVGFFFAWHVLGRPFALFLGRCCCCCVGGDARDLREVFRQPPFSEAWTCVVFGDRERRKATARRRVAHDDGDLYLAHDCTLYRRWASAEGGPPGKVKLTWEVMSTQHLATYNVVRNPDYERVMSLLDKLGYTALDDEEAITRPSAIRGVARVKKDDAAPDDAPTARVSAQAAAEEARALVNPTGRASKTAWGGDDPGAAAGGDVI